MKGNQEPMLYTTNAAVASLNHVPGFDPLKFLRRTTSRKTGEDVMRLDLRYKKLWFRLACPTGRLKLNALRIGAHRAQTGLVEQGVFALALHRSPDRAADLLIGHEGAELGFAAQRRYAHGMRIVAVEHHGVFERKHLIGRDVVEHPGLAQSAQGAEAERNFAAVERGVGQRGRALLLDEGDAQAAAGQRPHHGQAGRAGADDGEIERHVKVL